MVRRALGARPGANPDVGGLVQDEGEGSRQAHLQGVDADLAVALAAVAVARAEVRAWNPDRQEQRRAGDQLLAVHIAAVLTRLAAGEAAIAGRGSHARGAEER